MIEDTKKWTISWKASILELVMKYFLLFSEETLIFFSEWANLVVVAKQRRSWSISYRKGFFPRSSHVVCSSIVLCCSKTWMKSKKRFLNLFSSTATPSKPTRSKSWSAILASMGLGWSAHRLKRYHLPQTFTLVIHRFGIGYSGKWGNAHGVCEIQIVYDSPLKRKHDLQFCFEHGIHINFDNLQEVAHCIVLPF